MTKLEEAQAIDEKYVTAMNETDGPKSGLHVQWMMERYSLDASDAMTEEEFIRLMRQGEATLLCAEVRKALDKVFKRHGFDGWTDAIMEDAGPKVHELLKAMYDKRKESTKTEYSPAVCYLTEHPRKTEPYEWWEVTGDINRIAKCLESGPMPVTFCLGPFFPIHINQPMNIIAADTDKGSVQFDKPLDLSAEYLDSLFGGFGKYHGGCAVMAMERKK